MLALVVANSGDNLLPLMRHKELTPRDMECRHTFKWLMGLPPGPVAQQSQHLPPCLHLQV